ncbi:MAG: VWA domain-containing protein [Blastocatellia bacterium]|nr:VWA domain-containing protein [Blastocatellia bacterium]
MNRMTVLLKELLFVRFGWQVIGILVLCVWCGNQGMAQTPPQNDPVIKSRSDLVTVNVSVSDPYGRFVVGLEKQHFQLFENGVKQDIEFFNDLDVPISVGIVFDTSGSMKNALNQSRDILRRFIDSCLEQDEFFLVTFNNKVHLACDFTRDAEAIASAAATTEGKGSTSLYDAVYFGLEKLRTSHHDRRALIVISDQMENSSRYSWGELKKLVRELDIKVYWMPGLSELTGAASSTLNDPDFEHALRQVAFDLRRQYTLSYVPSEDSLKRNWNNITVKLTPPKGLPKLAVRARKGYSPTFIKP